MWVLVCVHGQSHANQSVLRLEVCLSVYVSARLRDKRCFSCNLHCHTEHQHGNAALLQLPVLCGDAPPSLHCYTHATSISQYYHHSLRLAHLSSSMMLIIYAHFKCRRSRMRTSSEGALVLIHTQLHAYLRLRGDAP